VPIVAIPWLIFEEGGEEKTKQNKYCRRNLPLHAPVATVLLESFHQVRSLALGRAAIDPNVSATADPAQNEEK